MVKMSVADFRDNLKQETNNLTSLCQHFRGVMKASPDLAENIVGDITVAIGQAELPMKEHFVQFSNLNDNCELKRGEKELTCQDLQGFWDIVHIQVEDVVHKFKQLKNLEKNGWEATKPMGPPAPVRQPLAKKVENKKIGPAKPSRGNSDLRAMIQAARQKARQEKSNANGDAKESRFMVCLEPSSPRKEAPEKVPMSAAFRTPTKAKTSVLKQHTPGRSEVRVLASSLVREQLHMSPVVHKNYSPCMRVTCSMKAWANVKKVLEERLKKLIKVDDRQFGFSPGRSTTDTIFIMRQMQEKFSEKKKLYHVFVNLEKASDRVPRKAITVFFGL